MKSSTFNQARSWILSLDKGKVSHWTDEEPEMGAYMLLAYILTWLDEACDIMTK